MFTLQKTTHTLTPANTRAQETLRQDTLKSQNPRRISSFQDHYRVHGTNMILIQTLVNIITMYITYVVRVCIRKRKNRIATQDFSLLIACE